MKLKQKGFTGKILNHLSHLSSIPWLCLSDVLIRYSLMAVLRHFKYQKCALLTNFERTLFMGLSSEVKRGRRRLLSPESSSEAGAPSTLDSRTHKSDRRAAEPKIFPLRLGETIRASGFWEDLWGVRRNGFLSYRTSAFAGACASAAVGYDGESQCWCYI